MSERTYPRQVWVLQPSFKPVAVEVVKKYGSSYHDYGDLTAKGKCYPVDEMHGTLEDAIAYGRQQCQRIRADIDKRTDNLYKKTAALDKAERK